MFKKAPPKLNPPLPSPRLPDTPPLQGTLGDRYRLYLEHTDEEYPLTFDQWLNR